MNRRTAAVMAVQGLFLGSAFSASGCGSQRDSSGLVVRLRSGSSELILIPTLHALPQRLRIPTLVTESLLRSKLVLFEVDLTDNSLSELRRACLASLVERTPRVAIADRQREKLRRFLADTKVPALTDNNAIPEFWSIVAAASVKQSGGERIEYGIDAQLIQHARALGLQIEFLESSCDAAEAQARVMAKRLDVHLLDEMIDSLESSHAAAHYKALMASWIEGRAALADAAYETLKAKAPLQYGLHHATVVERDKLLLGRIKNHLIKNDTVAVAIGMDHILMPGGLSTVLVDEGWKPIA